MSPKRRIACCYLCYLRALSLLKGGDGVSIGATGSLREKASRFPQAKDARAKSRIMEIATGSGRGAMCTGRSMTGRTCGLYRRENAGMSSESHVRNMAVESPRFPGEGSSTQGKSGPKPRAGAVGDGQQVEIPALPME
jgi:hypothetical protein